MTISKKAGDPSATAGSSSAQTSSLFVVVKVTSACNMRCHYCSAEKDVTRAPLLTTEVGRNVIHNLVELGLPSYNVCFHGGEPLLGFESVRGTVEYARSAFPERAFRFSIQSNLVNMTHDIACWCAEQGVSVGFSIDGDSSVNDRIRTFHDGSGTTEATLAGLKVLQCYQRRVGCVAVIGSHNWNTTARLVQFLSENDVQQLAVSRLAPVGRGLSDYGSLAPSDGQYAACLRDCYVAMVESDFEVTVKPILDWARKIVDPVTRSHGCFPCSAGWSHISVDPSGNVYPCDRFTFDCQWASGNLLDRPLLEILNEAKMVRCRTRMARIHRCRSCEIADVCGGGCAVTSFYRHGSIDLPGHECGSMRKLIPWLRERLRTSTSERLAVQAVRLGVAPIRVLESLRESL